MNNRLILPALMAGTMALAAVPAMAEKITIGLSSEPTAADPHYHNVSSNNALARHIFAYLTARDGDQNLRGDLAESWQAEDERTWVFNLRKGVQFSNGAPFEAKDVIFTFCRAVNNPTNVAGSFGEDLSIIESLEVVDPHTLRLRTTKVEPLLPEILGTIAILSASTMKHENLVYAPADGCGVTDPWPNADAFNNGQMAIGAGPFVLESFTKGAKTVLKRNESYHGDKPVWESVEFVPVPTAGPRLAGLLAGDYDFIENPSARDIPTLEGKFDHVAKDSARVIFLQLDQRDASPFVKAHDGRNPLKDLRVRQAINMAIDRETIVARVMDGFATPATQFAPVGMFGTAADLPALKYDPEAAKALLAEAGYPDGFEMTLSATNDRYINDAQVSQAVAQYLARVGIKTELDSMTRSVFFTRRAAKEFTVSMGGWGNEAGGAASFLRQYVATDNKAAAMGGSNYGEWSDAEFDALISDAVTTVDATAREPKVAAAGRRAMAELGFIPLHIESTLWAFRKDLKFDGRMDQYTLAQDIRKAE